MKTIFSPISLQSECLRSTKLSTMLASSEGVRMQTAAATLEISMEKLQRPKNK